ncbi:hypothetical protein CBJ24_23195 [Salmonella enterica]|nr:hypothetical protein [Salmonella enterica]
MVVLFAAVGERFFRYPSDSIALVRCNQRRIVVPVAVLPFFAQPAVGVVVIGGFNVVKAGFFTQQATRRVVQVVTFVLLK